MVDILGRLKLFNIPRHLVYVKHLISLGTHSTFIATWRNVRRTFPLVCYPRTASLDRIALISGATGDGTATPLRAASTSFKPCPVISATT